MSEKKKDNTPPPVVDIAEAGKLFTLQAQGSFQEVIKEMFGVEVDPDILVQEWTETKLAEHTIDGVKDTQGYEKVRKVLFQFRTARTNLDKKRKNIKQPIAQMSKDIDAYAASIIDKLSPIEQELKTRVDAIDAEKERLKLLKEKEEQERLLARVAKLLDAGCTYDSTNGWYIAGDIKIEALEVKKCEDPIFEKHLSNVLEYTIIKREHELKCTARIDQLKKAGATYTKGEGIIIKDLTETEEEIFRMDDSTFNVLMTSVTAKYKIIQDEVKEQQRLQKEKEAKDIKDREDFARQQEELKEQQARLKKQQEEADKKQQELERQTQQLADEKEKTEEARLNLLARERFKKIEETSSGRAHEGSQVFVIGTYRLVKLEIIGMTDGQFEEALNEVRNQADAIIEQEGKAAKLDARMSALARYGFTTNDTSKAVGHGKEYTDEYLLSLDEEGWKAVENEAHTLYEAEQETNKMYHERISLEAIADKIDNLIAKAEVLYLTEPSYIPVRDLAVKELKKVSKAIKKGLEVKTQVKATTK